MTLVLNSRFSERNMNGDQNKNFKTSSHIEHKGLSCNGQWREELLMDQHTHDFIPVLCNVFYVMWSFLNVKLLYFSVDLYMQQD